MWITLTGFMGSGKSSVARQLGADLGLPVVDLDAHIARQAGCSIAEIFAVEGEAEFRRRECAALEALDPRQELILDPGGGVIESGRARTSIVRGVVFWLDVRWDQVRSRLRGPEANRRPLVARLGWERLEALYHRRQRLYAQVADFRIASQDAGPSETARRVSLRLRSWQKAHRPQTERQGSDS